MVLFIYFSGQESDFGIGKIKKSITIYCVEHFFLLYKWGWNSKNRVSTLYITTKKIYYRLVIFNKTPLVLSSFAIAYIFSVQAVLAGDATSEGEFVPSLLVLSKILKLLTAHVSGKLPTTACLLLRVREWSDNIEGFFGSSLRGGNDKVHLTAFGAAALREAYRQKDLVEEADVPPYGSCGEITPFICNLVR